MTNDITFSGSGVTVGMDLADRYSQVCVLDLKGEVSEEGRVRTTQDALRSRFGALAPCRVVIEVGTHSPWVSRLLTELGHDCVVANPRRVRLIADSQKKNDRIDAETLARLGRADPALLSPVQHRSEGVQADLTLVHSRRALVEVRTKLINRTRALVKTFGAHLPQCDARNFPLKAAGDIPEQIAAAAAPLLKMISSLNAEIAALDRALEELIATRYPQARVLQQVPGVGPLISLTFVLTIEDPGRFQTSRQVGAYLGLVSRQRASGDRSPELGITKAGNVYLRQLLVNGAHYVLGHHGPDSDLRRWGLRKAEGGKNTKKRAVVAVARKLAVLLHRLWLTGEMYQPLRGEEVMAA
jgi:transposase